MTFRTPQEAVELANNTRYGLAASLWSENLPLVLDVSRQLQAGSVWVNCTNRFDAASGFGGYRESGFGREGGREGLLEYLRPRFLRPHSDGTRFLRPEVPARAGYPNPPLPPIPPKTSTRRRLPSPPPSAAAQNAPHFSSIDRTSKLYIGGAQRRPDGNYSYPIYDADGSVEGLAGAGNRKDIRDAVSAARSARDWARYTPHLRAQILFYLAENLSIRAAEFTDRLSRLLGMPPAPSAKSRSARNASSPSPPMPINSAVSSRKPPCAASSPPSTNRSASSPSSAPSVTRCSLS